MEKKKPNLLYVTPQLGIGGVETLVFCHTAILSRDFVVHVLPYRSNTDIEKKRLKTNGVIFYVGAISKEWQNIAFEIVIWNNVYSAVIQKSLKCAAKQQLFITHSDISFFNKRLKLIASRHKIVCIGDQIEQKLKNFVPNHKKILCWPNALEPTQFDSMYNKKKTFLPKKHNFVFVGRLDCPKRLDIVVDGIAKTDFMDKDIFLTVVGDGPRRRIWESHCAKRLKTSSFAFVGAKSHEETLNIINESDVLVLASASEGLPMVLIEAMLCGTLVISSDIGCVSEVVEDNRTGFLFPMTEVSEFSQKMLSCGGNYQCVETICTNFQQKYSTGFSNCIKRYLDMPLAEAVSMRSSAHAVVAKRYEDLCASMSIDLMS